MQAAAQVDQTTYIGNKDSRRILRQLLIFLSVAREIVQVYEGYFCFSVELCLSIPSYLAHLFAD